MDPTESESQYATQINVKMSTALKQGLEQLSKDHGVPPAETLRRLAQMAIDYEKTHGELPLKHLLLIKAAPSFPAPTREVRAREHALRKTINENVREDAEFSVAPDMRIITPPRKPRTNGRGGRAKKSA